MLFCRHYVQVRRHVRIECDGAQVLVVRGIVEIDGVTGLINIEDLAVGAGLKCHARASGKLRLAVQAPVLQIESPKFISSNLLHQAVTVLATRGKRKADKSGRTEGIEIDALLWQIHSGHSHQAAVLHGVLYRKKPRKKARLLVDLVHGSEVDPAEAILDRTRDFPLIHLLELRRVVDQDILGKKIKQFAVGRHHDIGELPLLAFWPGDGSHHLVRFKIVLEESRRSNFKSIRKLGGGFSKYDQESVQWVDGETSYANLFVAFAELKIVDDLPRSDVHNLHFFKGRI